jgi:hypothetical protein
MQTRSADEPMTVSVACSSRPRAFAKRLVPTLDIRNVRLFDAKPHDGILISTTPFSLFLDVLTTYRCTVSQIPSRFRYIAYADACSELQQQVEILIEGYRAACVGVDVICIDG